MWEKLKTGGTRTEPPSNAHLVFLPRKDIITRYEKIMLTLFFSYG